MTHIALQRAGINSDQFRDTVDRHLEAMSMNGWELVSTSITDSAGFKTGYSVDALFFWKKPD